MPRLRITVTVTPTTGTVRRCGFNTVGGARYWVGRNRKDPTDKVEVTGDATLADICPDLVAPPTPSVRPMPEIYGDASEEVDEPPTCGMCDGIHGGTHCPLEDTGWEQSFEPWWAQ